MYNHLRNFVFFIVCHGNMIYSENSSVPNNRVVTTIYFGIFSNIFIKLGVIFYVTRRSLASLGTRS